MGIAASQARMLALTARKSNIEFQGQQINQQRTTLANESASYNSQLLGLVVPTPPSTSDYTTTSYKMTINGQSVAISPAGIVYDDASDSYTVPYTYTVTDDNGNEIIQTNNLQNTAITWTETNRISSITGSDGTKYSLTVTSTTDEDSYDDAMNEYLYQKQMYEQEMNNYNAKLEIVQQQDKTLELQLTQLDTEQKAVSTEEEAVTKVLEKNAEAFKTFA